MFNPFRSMMPQRPPQQNQNGGMFQNMMQGMQNMQQPQQQQQRALSPFSFNFGAGDNFKPNFQANYSPQMPTQRAASPSFNMGMGMGQQQKPYNPAPQMGMGGLLGNKKVFF